MTARCAWCPGRYRWSSVVPARRFVEAPRSQFHLGCGEHAGVMPFGELGQPNLGDAPAAMAQTSVERRVANDIAGETHRRSVESSRQRNPAALGLIAHRHDLEVLAQDLGA